MGGAMPFGFAWNEAAQEWEPVEAEHRVLMEIRQLRRQGLGARKITAELNRRGIPTRKGTDVWRPSTVEHILKNPFYVRVQV